MSMGMQADQQYSQQGGAAGEDDSEEARRRTQEALRAEWQNQQVIWDNRKGKWIPLEGLSSGVPLAATKQYGETNVKMIDQLHNSKAEFFDEFALAKHKREIDSIWASQSPVAAFPSGRKIANPKRDQHGPQLGAFSDDGRMNADGSRKKNCILKVDADCGAGIRFIYDSKGWWIYEVRRQPGQKELRYADLIVAVAGHSIIQIPTDDQVAIVKEGFKNGALIEVLRGYELPFGHMDESGTFIWHTDRHNLPQKDLSYAGLGVRPITRYLHVSNMSKKTSWVKLRNFLMPYGETVKTQILRQKVKGAGKNSRNTESKGEAIVEMQTAEACELVITGLQNAELDGKKVRFDVSTIAPANTTGGYQKRSTSKKNGRFGSGGGREFETQFSNDKEKVEFHAEVAQAIVDKLVSHHKKSGALPILTQHWVGKHLNHTFGCGQLRKLVFMEPLDYYDSRHEVEAVMDSENLNDKGQMHAFKIRLRGEYGSTVLGKDYGTRIGRMSRYISSVDGTVPQELLNMRERQQGALHGLGHQTYGAGTQGMNASVGLSASLSAIGSPAALKPQEDGPAPVRSGGPNYKLPITDLS